MRKRVSWEVIEGCKYIYYMTRKQALAHVRAAKEKHHPIEMNWWELVGDETSSRQVDIEALLAAEEAKQQRIAVKQETIVFHLPAVVWAEVVQSLRL